MARRINKEVIINGLIKMLDAGQEVTVNPIHSKWVIDVLKNKGYLITISSEVGIWKIKRRSRKYRDAKVDKPIHEVKSYCIDRGILIYPIKSVGSNYSIQVSRNGLIENVIGDYKTDPTTKDEKWYDKIALLYKYEYLKLKENE